MTSSIIHLYTLYIKIHHEISDKSAQNVIKIILLRAYLCTQYIN